ncbi:MAG: HD-GYP domain-containing protein [Candidatus Contubernalis sp.]|nr:HD-GYP domain-containing protein [Candidatus Contubernalis sp.]
MSFREQPLILKIYIIVVIASGVAFLYFFQPQWSPTIVMGFLFFAVLNIASEHLAVSLPKGESFVSVSLAFTLASILIFGPEVAAWVAFFGIFTYKDITSFKNYYYRTLFNGAQAALAAGAAGMAYVYLGGITGVLTFPGDIIAILAACIVCFFINTGAIIVVMSISQGVSMWGLWLVNFRWAIPNYAALAPLGIVISVVYLQIGIPGVLLLIVPLLLARYSFLQYMEMRLTYLSTIKALTKAIDAKDHYTHGHSERVAKYSVAIGRAMKLQDDYLEKLEYVALLHDVGKVAISELIINKPDRLLENEMLAIQQHSIIGAEIIAEVRLIADLVDVIRYHHERIDGGGYPLGKKGEEIPMGARIVGVADAFDAMTTDRVYRKALSQQEALKELQRCSGTQFDPHVVEVFVGLIERGELEQ